MAANSEHGIVRLWQHGIYLWENEGAYLDAMEVFDEALLVTPPLAKFLQPPYDDETNYFDESGEHPSEDCLLPPVQQNPSDTEDVSNYGYLAPLLLFMAGCYLDAQQYPKARRYCQAAWSFAPRKPVSSAKQSTHDGFDFENMHHRILCEYMAAWDEDPNVQNGWAISKQIALDAQTNARSFILWRHADQRPGFFYPLPTNSPNANLPVCPREQHPFWCRQLEQQYETILQDFRQLCHFSPTAKVSDQQHQNTSAPQNVPFHWPTVGGGDHREGAGSHDGMVVGEGGDWREYVLFGSGADHYPSTTTQAARTRKLIRQLAPDAVTLAESGGGEIIFSLLAPHTRIMPHCASTNLRWTAHLGLFVPSLAKIRVSDVWHTWEEGKMLVFDDSFEHEVRNDSDSVRAVLLLRFWHPDIESESERSEAIRQALRWKELEKSRRYHPPVPPSSGADTW